MKINLADVASFATGFLNANQKNTENNLKLRQEQLKADRDFNSNTSFHFNTQQQADQFVELLKIAS